MLRRRWGLNDCTMRDEYLTREKGLERKWLPVQVGRLRVRRIRCRYAAQTKKFPRKSYRGLPKIDGGFITGRMIKNSVASKRSARPKEMHRVEVGSSRSIG